ncbi:hypothetical protein [Nocardia sp. NPDC050710]
MSAKTALIVGARNLGFPVAAEYAQTAGTSSDEPSGDAILTST